jgi:DNA-binding response OmpR family regulator
MQPQPHILFADDEPDLRELVQLVLPPAGFRVSTTDTTEGVLKLMAAERFDALLLDHWMPQLSGIELCRRIRAFDQTTPIVICSGAITQAEKDAACQAGAQGFLSKPFNCGDLIRAVRSCL